MTSRLLKRLISGALALTLVFSINGFAAVVTDNDGSAFVTKAEFDSLKSSFQSQIDSYNQAIDSKIDGAIAAYLAGIKVTTEMKLDNYLTLLNPVFIKDLNFNESHLGTKYKIFISYVFANVRYHGAKYCFAATAPTWYTPSEMIKNETDQEIIYQLNKIKYIDGTEEYLYIDKILKPTYSAAATGGDAGSKPPTGDPAVKQGTFWLAAQTITKESNQQWHARSVQTTWQQSTPFGDNLPQSNLNLWCSWSATDEVEELITRNYFSGGAMDSSNVIHTCLNTELQLMGDKFAEDKPTDARARRVDSQANGAVVEESRSDIDSTMLQPIIEIYRHKITDVYQSDLIVKDASDKLSFALYYYNGAPMFKAPIDGRVRMRLNFQNSNSTTTTYAISNDKFPNAALTTGCGTIAGCNITNWTVNSGDTVDLEFDVENGKTYYIKANPNAGTTQITLVGDVKEYSE